MRTVKSKKLRDLLLIDTLGKCAICGKELEKDWEADHKVAWRITHRTNIFELQATCRKCNRKKG